MWKFLYLPFILPMPVGWLTYPSWTVRPFVMSTKRCLETSGTEHPFTQRNIPKERIPHSLRPC